MVRNEIRITSCPDPTVSEKETRFDFLPPNRK